MDKTQDHLDTIPGITIQEFKLWEETPDRVFILSSEELHLNCDNIWRITFLILGTAIGEEKWGYSNQHM